MEKELMLNFFVVFVVGFLWGFLFKSWGARKEEKRWKKEVEDVSLDRHHFIYRWNVAINRLGAIRHMIDVAGVDGSSPYRGDSAKLVEVLSQVRKIADENLALLCKEVGCFEDLEDVEAYLLSLDDGLCTFPMIIKHEEWDGTCWHVIFGTNVPSLEERCRNCESGKPTHECVGQCVVADDYVGVL
jgi:hypothetical protein